MILCAALQLHPDKNNHPKAETAFKLLFQVFLFFTPFFPCFSCLVQSIFIDNMEIFCVQINIYLFFLFFPFFFVWGRGL